MSASLLLGLALAGGLGACLRHLVDVAGRRLGATSYLATALVNVAGSFLLGLLQSRAPGAAAVWGVGFCGGLTTFSTAVLQPRRLWQAGDPLLLPPPRTGHETPTPSPATRAARAGVHAVGMLLACVLAALVGYGFH